MSLFLFAYLMSSFSYHVTSKNSCKEFGTFWEKSPGRTREGGRREKQEEEEEEVVGVSL